MVTKDKYIEAAKKLGELKHAKPSSSFANEIKKATEIIALFHRQNFGRHTK